jgi:RNAse (barnase) inhibitor barstar
MTILYIDLSEVQSFDQLQEILKEKFCFPDFYGQNWNAFWDSITGLVQMPDKLEIAGWQHFSNSFPEDAEILVECLEDYNKQTDLKKIEIFYT